MANRAALGYNLATGKVGPLASADTLTDADGTAVGGGGGAGNKTFFLQPQRDDSVFDTPTLEAVGSWGYIQVANLADYYFTFVAPDDWSDRSSVAIAVFNGPVSSLQVDILVSVAAPGELSGNDTRTVNNINTTGMTTYRLNELDINSGTAFASINPGDYVAISVNNDSSTTDVLGLRVTYT